jgi:hypothetical protein
MWGNFSLFSAVRWEFTGLSALVSAEKIRSSGERERERERERETDRGRVARKAVRWQ